MGCRSIALGFVLVAPEDLPVRQAYARVQRYRLRDCDGNEAREWVGQRLDLLYTTPEVIRDREWCGIDISFREAPLFGPPLGWRGETAAGTAFDIALSPGTVSLERTFGGAGEDQVILLDLDAMMTAVELDTAARKTDPPLDEVEYLEDSAWSQDRASQLAGALSVVSLEVAQQRLDWPIGAYGPPTEGSGCGAARQDTGFWWGDTAYPDYESIPNDTGTLPPDTGTAPASSGGCSCESPGADTSDPDDTEDEDTGATSSGGGCLGGSSDSGSDSDSDSGWVSAQRRLGLAALVGVFWLRRRRGGTAGPAPR